VPRGTWLRVVKGLREVVAEVERERGEGSG
jgi:hypothetical protein